MIEYSLQTLRNETVMINRDAALAALDTYKHHLVGQPISLMYYTDSSKTVTKTIFAIGKKNGNGEQCGEDYYEILNGASDTTVRWSPLTITKVNLTLIHEVPATYVKSTNRQTLIDKWGTYSLLSGVARFTKNIIVDGGVYKFGYVNEENRGELEYNDLIASGQFANYSVVVDGGDSRVVYDGSLITESLPNLEIGVPHTIILSPRFD